MMVKIWGKMGAEGTHGTTAAKSVAEGAPGPPIVQGLVMRVPEGAPSPITVKGLAMRIQGRPPATHTLKV